MYCPPLKILSVHSLTSTVDSHFLKYLHCQIVGSLKSDKSVRISSDIRHFNYYKKVYLKHEHNHLNYDTYALHTEIQDDNDGDLKTKTVN